jgi:hypothetical protein
MIQVAKPLLMREVAEIKTIVDEDKDFQSKKPNDSGSDDVWCQ